MSTAPRIIHFVTGGGSGATRVALEIACGHLRSGAFEPLLVFRRKKNPLPAAMADLITRTGLRTAWVDRWPKGRTLSQLRALIAEFGPQVFVAHGNSEHLWGRQAAFAAGVRAVVHVEQNCERYPFWRVWAARRLAARTSATICVSSGVADHVRALGIAGPRLEMIHNGSDAGRFQVGAPALATRGPDIVMLARFARQKDQPTLIRAAQLMVASGWTGRLVLGGDGKASHRRDCERLVRSLGIADRVDFPGRVGDPVSLLHKCRAAVLSTHYEGLPLALVESMAAGCAVVGSAVPGVTDIVEHGVNGWSFPVGDHAKLADILLRIMRGGAEIERVATRGTADALSRFSIAQMLARHEALYREILG